MALETWLAFFVACWVISLSPGAGAIASMSSGLQYGFWRGYWNALGLQLGLALQIAIVAAGVGAILATSALAFSLIKWFGVAYLVYLGLRMILAKPGAAPTLEIKPRQYLWQTLVITLFNPKAIVFYMAFFPLFIDPQRHQGLVTFAFMAVTIMLLTFLYGLLVVLLTHRLAERMRANPRIARGLEKLAGLFLVGFGVKLTLN